MGRPALSERNKDRRAEFARRIQLIRETAGLTQEQLGASLGVTGQQVAKWEGTERPVPAEVLWDMAVALGVTVPYLMGAVSHINDQTQLAAAEAA